MTDRTAPTTVGDPKCPTCSGGFHDSEWVAICTKDGSLHHMKCWNSHGRCATCGGRLHDYDELRRTTRRARGPMSGVPPAAEASTRDAEPVPMSTGPARRSLALRSILAAIIVMVMAVLVVASLWKTRSTAEPAPVGVTGLNETRPVTRTAEVESVPGVPVVAFTDSTRNLTPASLIRFTVRTPKGERVYVDAARIELLGRVIPVQPSDLRVSLTTGDYAIPLQTVMTRILAEEPRLVGLRSADLRVVCEIGGREYSSGRVRATFSPAEWQRVSGSRGGD